MTIAKKVLDNLRAQLPLTLPKFLAALGIENFGLQTAKAIVAAGFDTLEKVQKATAAELSAIPGVGPSKGKAAFEGITDRKAAIARLVAVGVEPITKTKAGPLLGKTFCFTGSLSKPRKEFEQLVEDNGGTLLAGVTKELNYLVMSDPNSGSSKSQKARQYGTVCIDEAGFFALIKSSGKAGAKPKAKSKSASA